MNLKHNFRIEKQKILNQSDFLKIHRNLNQIKIEYHSKKILILQILFMIKNPVVKSRVFLKKQKPLYQKIRIKKQFKLR